MNERNPTYKTLFSMSTLAISVAAAGSTYRSLGGVFGALSTNPLQPLMGAAMTYFLVNSVAVAGAFALTTRRNVFHVWHDNFLWSVSSYVVGAIAADFWAVVGALLLSLLLSVAFAGWLMQKLIERQQRREEA